MIFNAAGHYKESDKPSSLILSLWLNAQVGVITQKTSPGKRW